MIEIIIADDNIFLAEALAEKLNKSQDIFVKKTFNNLDDLLNFLPENKLDVLILDINFNGISSLDYVQKIRAFQPKIKIIALTSLNNDFIKQEAINKGINYFKGKDSSIVNFDEYIRSCFNDNNNISDRETNSYMVDGVKFTKTKIKVLQALYDHSDKTESEVAVKLNISTSSLKTHKRQLYHLTGTTKVVDLIKFGIKNGILLQ